MVEEYRRLELTMNVIQFKDSIWILIFYLMNQCACPFASNAPIVQTLTGNLKQNITYAVNTIEHINPSGHSRPSAPDYGGIPIFTQGIPDEQRLMNYLFNGYERTVRPVRNASTPVVIRMGLTMTQIFDMDEKDQVLVTNVWLDQEWVDEFMRWDPDEFANITILRIPCHKLWLPDIVLYNNAAEYTDGLMPANAMVRHDGNVFWPVPTKLQSSCKVDVTYFPFDDQTCRMKFGSWTYDGFQGRHGLPVGNIHEMMKTVVGAKVHEARRTMNFRDAHFLHHLMNVDITNRTSEVDLTNYVNNGEWLLLGIKIVRNVVYYACCDEPFPDVTFLITIRRRTLYYMYNVIFPCIMMSALTLLVFCLPPDSGEKIALGITVLLAFSVFMLAVAENLPETSEFVPLISIYLTIVMALTSMSVIMTVFVLNLHHRGPNKRRVPRWLKEFLVNKLSTYLCLNESDEVMARYYKNEDRFIKNVSLKITLDNIQQALQNETQLENAVNNLRETTVTLADNHVNSVPYTQTVRTQMYPTMQTLQPQQQYGSGLQQTASTSSSQTTNDNFRRHKRKSTSALSKTNEEILQSLRRILEKHEREDKDYEMIQDWRRVAQVIDRILFIIFFLATTWSTLGILVIAPAARSL